MKRSFSLPCSLVLLAACGGAQPPAEVPAPTATAVATGPDLNAAPDLSPLPEPKALVAVARWKSPAKGIDRALKVFGVPMSIEGMITKEAGDVANVLDLDASVDLAVSLDPESTDDSPKFLAAVSIPLKGFDQARASAEKDAPLTPVAPGVLRLPTKRTEKAGTCDLAAAAGDAPARLVCGAHPRDTDALRPWLVRGLSRAEPAASDMVISLRAAPLRDRYLDPLRKKAAALGDEARTALTKQGISDPELLGAAGVVLDESLHFVEDVDALDLRVAFGATPPELVAGGVLRFGAKTSWITRALTDANDKAGPAPAVFWRAPRDASSATWGRGNDPHLYDGVRKVIHKALGEALAKAPLPDADKGALLAFVDGVPKTAGAWVSTQGLIHAKGKAAKITTGAPIDIKALAASAMGWNITGVEAPAADYVAWMKQGVDVYARGLRIAHDFLALSGKSKSGKKEEDPLLLAPKVTTLTSPPGWPKGTVAFDVAVKGEIAELFLPKKKAAKGDKADATPKKKESPFKGTLTFRLAIVPDGDRTWLGFSADLDELKKRMNAVITGAPDDGTLAAREGLEGMKAPGQTWGGFFSVGDLLERVVDQLEKEKPQHAADARAVLAALPNHGRTPVLFSGSGTAGDKPTSAAEVRLEAGTLTDLAALLKFLDSPRGKELLKKLD